jgi:hypothetical protein
MSERKRGERGRAQATLDLIEACLKILEQCQPFTVRGVCYRLFVVALIASMEKPDTNKISRILTRAREDGLIPWEWIVDDSRVIGGERGFRDLAQYGLAVERSYRRNFWEREKHRIILISEKGTVAGILRPVLEETGVSFFSVRGFNSATKVHDLAEQISSDARHYILLYVGDWDPSGMFMSEVDFPGRLREYGARNFTFQRIALTAPDLEELPSFPAVNKIKDKRYRWFVEHYGADCWELDAMDPNVLRNRVLSFIEPYRDKVSWERHLVIEAAERRTTKMIASQFAAMHAEGA